MNIRKRAFVSRLLGAVFSLERGDGGVDVSRRQRTVEEVMPYAEKEPKRVEDGEAKPHAGEGVAVYVQCDEHGTRGDEHARGKTKESLMALHQALSDENDAVERLQQRADDAGHLGLFLNFRQGGEDAEERNRARL